jgi:hypothetical protein
MIRSDPTGGEEPGGTPATAPQHGRICCDQDVEPKPYSLLSFTA